jgi:large subunit ribosomal protein L30
MPEKETKNEHYAAIIIRGIIGMKQEIKDTLKMLRLRKKHACIIIPKNRVNEGMLKKCKDYITYGEISLETIKLLKKKGDKKVYHLAPPRGGYERKGVKQPFTKGGALGYRKEKINELIKKMI